MPMNDGMYSSKSGRWETPDDFFTKLDAEFHFDVDVCANAENTKCEHWYEEDEALDLEWQGICFMNPPYGREISKWIKKAYIESRKIGCIVVALIPSRTDTRWWHKYIMRANEIRFIIGRLKFINRSFPSYREDGNFKRSPAPFPSAVVVWSHDHATFPLVRGYERQ